MKISEYAKRVKPSLARELFNQAKNYEDVIDLTLGDPDFETPCNIREAACESIKAGRTHYSANAGLIEAREAVANHIFKNWNIKPDANREVIITVGGMEALFLSLACIINPDDEVIIFAPYYVNYVQMIRFLGGIPIIIDAYTQDIGMQIDEIVLSEKISEKTVAIVINSPNNPTGDVYDYETLSKLANIVVEKGMVLISDEVYKTLLFDDIKHESILQFEKVRNNVILIDSLSKEFCMTGWRIGYAYGNSIIIQNMVKLQENVAACATVPSQYALIEAYSEDYENNYVLQQFQERRNYLYTAINDIEKLSCRKPKGTFYLFVNIEATGLDSLEFANRLLLEEHVAVIPGETYGSSYREYVRIAFTKDVSILELAIDKIKRFVNSL